MTTCQKRYAIRVVRATFYAAALCLFVNAPAQVPAPAAGPTLASGEKNDDEKVVLSPFVVRGDKDSGYQAGNSLAGSRLNTELKDTAAAISVFTKEFLNDIGVTDVNHALE
jgi:outer membrane receptor for ferric coprogen and ferric-rhodotorulic acid